ncbi:MAG: radical SAM protein [Candidatus Nezhaarchaeales archaeon]
MSIKNLISAIRLVLGNRLSRFVINRMVSPCPHGHRSKLEHALNYVVGEASIPLSLCKVEGWALKSLISIMTRMMHVDFEVFRNYAKDPSVRRGLTLVLKGIAKYGITVPQKLPAPFLIVWNFTNMCNLKCKHCYQRADRPSPDELTLSEKMGVVNQLDEADVAAIAFSGGEPLIHPDFPVVAHEAASRGMYVSVATNGTMITRELAGKLKELGVKYVEVSLDSVNSRRHDNFRGVPGAWEKAVRGIKSCIEEGLTTGVAMTLTKMNHHEVEDMVDFCEDLGVNRVIFFNFIPTGRGVDITDWDLTPEEREEALKTIYKLARSRKLEVVSTAPQLARVSLQESSGCVVAPTHFSLAADPGILALAEFIGGCGAGRIYSAIEPNGDVVPCVFMPIKVGNLKSERFEDLWNKSSILLRLRNRESFEEPCGKCQYKYVCGGCRARAYAYTNCITGPDPGCINFKLMQGEVDVKREEYLELSK